MKKFFIILGSIFLVVIVLDAIGIAFVAVPGNALDKEEGLTYNASNRWPTYYLVSLYENTTRSIHIRPRQRWLILFSLGPILQTTHRRYAIFKCHFITDYL